MKDQEQPVQPSLDFIAETWLPNQLNTRYEVKVAQHEASFQNDALGIFPIEPDEHSFLRIEKIGQYNRLVSEKSLMLEDYTLFELKFDI